MDSPSLNESDTEDSFMKRIIMHNRSQSEDVLRPQAFSRASVRPRHNRLTLANLERLPVPEPPQVTTKSDLGSIGSRSSSERSRDKLEAIRQRELQIQEEETDAVDGKDQQQPLQHKTSFAERIEQAAAIPTPAPLSPPPSPPPQHRHVALSARATSRDAKREIRRVTPPTREAQSESLRALAKELNKESSKERAQSTAQTASHDQSREPMRKPARTSSQDVARETEQVEEGSDIVHIRNMGNHLRSLSANLEGVRTGMDNISKMTGKPATKVPTTGDTLVRMSDRDVFEATKRAIWAGLWLFRHDSSGWLPVKPGPGFWLLLSFLIPFYALLECVSCMIWCRPVFADSMEGLGIFPDAPELPFVIPTMLMRPLRPLWAPFLQVVAPVFDWIRRFSSYVAQNAEGNVL